MGQTGRFFKDLEGVFGAGNVTSGYRSQQEQDALVRAGKTKATRSAHTYNEGYDLKIGVAKTPEELRDRLVRAGHEVKYIRRETGKGKNQGTGAHWHIELGSPGKGGTRMAGNAPSNTINATSPGRGVADTTRFLDQLDSTLAPEVKASGAVTQNSSAIFNSDKKIGAGYEAIGKEITRQGAALDVLDQVTQVAHAQQVASKVRQIEETRAISNEILTGTQELQRQVTPVFQARKRIADQMDHLTTMNPLERGIRGIFDLNYDKDYLEGQLDSFDRTLKARSDDFNYLTTLGRVGMEEIARRYELDTGITDLNVKQATEDLTLTGLRIQQTQGMLGNTLDEINTQSRLIAAKNTARQDMLGRIDGPTVADLHAQAVKNNGVVSFNGVEFSANELRDRIKTDEQQAVNFRLHAIAAANGELQLAESVATNITKSLTREQAAAAAANGGVYTTPDGQQIQLDQTELTQIIANHSQRADIMAKDIAARMPYTAAAQIAVDTVNQMNGLFQRGASILGRSQGFGQATTRSMNEVAQLSRQLQEAIEQKQPPEVIRALTEQIGAAHKGFQAQVDSTILQHVGGDKIAAGYTKAFIYNQPLDSGAAAEAIAHFAMKGSMPQGMTASPLSKQIFQRLQTRAVELQGQKGMTASKLQSLLTQEAQQLATTMVGQARWEDLEQRLPTLAATAKHDFGKINRQFWLQINAEANRAGAAAVARKLNTTPENVELMIRTGKPLDATPASKTLYDQVTNAENSSLYNSQMQQTLVESLDNLPNVRPGTRNSEVMQEFIGSNTMLQRISEDNMIRGTLSMGDYLVNPLAPGATESVARQYSRGLADAAAARDGAARQTARDQQRAFGNSASARVLTILAAIPGVGKEGRDALQPFIREQMGNPVLNASAEGAMNIVGNPVLNPGGAIANASIARAREMEVLAALSRVKFDDPIQEAYRKAAVKGWKDVSAQSDSFLDVLKEAMTLSWDF